MSDWPEVKARILDNIFFNFTPATVEASRDLTADGFMDSLSVIGIVTTIDDHLGGEHAQTQARREDFLSLDSIRQLYLRLIEEA